MGASICANSASLTTSSDALYEYDSVGCAACTLANGIQTKANASSALAGV